MLRANRSGLHRFIIPEKGLRVVETGLEALDDRGCFGEPRDRARTLELSTVRIGLETYRSHFGENEMQIDAVCWGQVQGHRSVRTKVFARRRVCCACLFQAETALVSFLRKPSRETRSLEHGVFRCSSVFIFFHVSPRTRAPRRSLVRRLAGVRARLLRIHFLSNRPRASEERPISSLAKALSQSLPLCCSRVALVAAAFPDCCSAGAEARFPNSKSAL